MKRAPLKRSTKPLARNVPLRSTSHPPTGSSTVVRSYKFRAYPTRPQESRAIRMLADHCALYNAALEERREAWERRKASINFYDQDRQLKDIRAEDPDGQGRYSYNSQRATIRRLDLAFKAFYRRCKAGQKPGYPRYRSRSRFDTIEFTHGNGSKWHDRDGRWAHCRLQGVGTIKVHQHRAVSGAVKTVKLRREGLRWYVTLTVERPVAPLAAVDREIGVDVGVARFLTTSDGEIVDNPRWLRTAEDELADAQQAVARCKRGSANQKRARRKVAKIHRKIRNKRRDFHHKQARKLVDSCDAIAVEDLNTADLTKRPAPRPDVDGSYEPNGAAAKAGLNKSILDAGWASFIQCLTYKAEEAGRRVVKVDPAWTSQTCHRCGARGDRIRQDTLACPTCGPVDADWNAAVNILIRAGLGSEHAQACEVATVRRDSHSTSALQPSRRGQRHI